MNKLEKYISEWIKKNAPLHKGGKKGLLHDLMYNGGCITGAVKELKTSSQIRIFYKRYKFEINEVLAKKCDDCSLDDFFLFKWDVKDPLAFHDWNQKVLSYFAFEETVVQLLRSESV